MAERTFDPARSFRIARWQTWSLGYLAVCVSSAALVAIYSDQILKAVILWQYALAFPFYLLARPVWMLTGEVWTTLTLTTGVLATALLFIPAVVRRVRVRAS